MKKNRKSIFKKLLASYFIFTLIALVGLFVVFLIAVFQTASVKNKLTEYPYVEFAEDGRITSFEAITQMDGWVELLDADYCVTEVVGEKKSSAMAYSAAEIMDMLSKTQSQVHDSDYVYNVFYHCVGEHRYLICFPKEKFELVYNLNVSSLVYTSFNKSVLVLLFVFLGALVLGVSLFISKRITKPMSAISEGMNRVASGEEEVEIPIYADKEFVEIQNAFQRMTKELHDQKKEKEEILRRRHQMLLELSHDIKTPVSTIKSYAYALSEHMVPEEEVEKYYHTIAAKADRVNQLTMDLFTLLKMESSDYKVTKTHLNYSELVRTVLANMYEEITSAGFDFDIEVPDDDYYVEGDEIYLIRALENLLNNARKYNRTGKMIAVELCRQKDAICLTVKDDGKAIPEETAKEMFVAFSRGEQSRTSDGGTGLGLAITRQIVEKHGGTLIYEYAEGYNCFRIQIEQV